MFYSLIHEEQQVVYRPYIEKLLDEENYKQLNCIVCALAPYSRNKCIKCKTNYFHRTKKGKKREEGNGYKQGKMSKHVNYFINLRHLKMRFMLHFISKIICALF